MGPTDLREARVLRTVRRELLARADADADDLAGSLPPSVGDRRAVLRRAARRVVTRLLLRSRAALLEPGGRELAPVLARLFGPGEVFL
ncbi:MAG: hypothetical protein L0216_16185 [Planctomycetales bacterium]|nr:hypothetical protein [Planctomycetales bacterium]